MSSNRRRNRWSALLLVLPLAGCADYLNRYDTVTLAAGDAQKHNLMLHSVKPLNPESRNTSIESDGRVVADSIEQHRTRLRRPPAQPANVTVNVGTN